jgi:PAS domain S-box-containing protein
MRSSIHRHLKQLMVDGLRDCALIVVGIDGKVMSWNAGAKDLLGHDEADMVGQPFSSIVLPKAPDPAGPLPSLAIAHANGRHEEICRRTHRNGAAIEVREVVIPLRDPEQDLLAFGVMMQSSGPPRDAGEKPAVDAGSSAAARPLSLLTRKVTKLLVVDDDDTIRTIAEHMLQDLGYEVLAASSGAEALDILARDKSIDLLFTDVVMPGMDGGELAERARLMRPELKILFTSGYFEHALIKKGTISRNADLLVKPYQGNTLAMKIETMLAKDGNDPGELS